MRGQEMTERKVLNLRDYMKSRTPPVRNPTPSPSPSPTPDTLNPPPTLEAIPEFIEPTDISKMTDAQFTTLLELIRMRRMTATIVYQQTMEEKEKVVHAKLAAALEKKAEQIYKKMEMCFKHLEQLELKINELRALRLQAGLEF
jgi:hypothetical protein